MGSDPVELKVRVIVVTTRAALRHAGTDARERRAIVMRGRQLLDALEAESRDGDRPLVARARADLDALLEG